MNFNHGTDRHMCPYCDHLTWSKKEMVKHLAWHVYQDQLDLFLPSREGELKEKTN